MDATPLAEALRDFFGPLFFVFLGILAIFQLFKLNLARVFQLALMGIVISILLYRPDVIRGMAQQIAALLLESFGAA